MVLSHVIVSLSVYSSQLRSTPLSSRGWSSLVRPPPGHKVVHLSRRDAGLLVAHLLLFEVRRYREVCVPLRVVTVDAVIIVS